MISGVYTKELTVIYNAPKPEKILFTEDDLYHSDTFAFGSIIGSITNKSTSAYALLPIIENKYGKDSEEYRILNSRLQQCCKAQSAQIDKTKIGRDVKGIPKIWTEKQDNELYNHILLNRHPYFFRYLYKEANKKYKQHYKNYNDMCLMYFNMTIDELLTLHQKTIKQQKFIEKYYEKMPLIYSNSTMNLLCRYIENINFEISSKIRINCSQDLYKIYKDNNLAYDETIYTKIKSIVDEFLKDKRNEHSNSKSSNDFQSENENKDNLEEIEVSNNYDDLKIKLLQYGDANIVTNCLVDYFYINSSTNKDILWAMFGNVMFDNVKYNSNFSGKTKFPMPSNDGDILYLGERYKWEEVIL